MRAVMAIALTLSLAACDDASQPGAGATAPAGEITAERVEASRACAELTGFSPDMPRGADGESVSLLEKEFDSCVAAVLGGDKPALRGRAEEAQPAVDN